MRLKMVQVNKEVFTPNGGGATATYLRDKQFELAIEGAFVRVRFRGVTNGDVYEIPMANVAIIERFREDEAPTVPEKRKP